MNATTSIPTQTEQKRPGIRNIMTWNGGRPKGKIPTNLHGHDSASEDDQSVPASPTHIHKSPKNGRPSIFAVFARRNSKSLSEHSSPTSPRLSTDGIPDDFRSPSPTPSWKSRKSMIFERDIEQHDRLSVHEAIDLGIPSVLDVAADAFASDEIPGILAEDGNVVEHEGANSDSDGNQWPHGKRLSGNFVDNRQPSPGPFDQKQSISETLRVTTPKEMNEFTGTPWK